MLPYLSRSFYQSDKICILVEKKQKQHQRYNTTEEEGGGGGKATIRTTKIPNGGAKKDTQVCPGRRSMEYLQRWLLSFLQVKRIIGQRDARLKKNQDKAVVQSKRKSKDELVREMSVSASSSF